MDVPRLFNRTLEGPAVRWRHAQELAPSSDPIHRGVDPWTRRAAAYLSRAQHGRGAAADAVGQFPDIAAAVAFWDRPAAQETFQILTIAGCPRAEVAQRLNLPEPFVEAIEALFFDVRDRLDAPSWIANWAISPAAQAGDYQRAARLRLAHCGGPAAARALLEARVGLPYERAERLADLELLLYARLQAVLEAPLAEKDHVAFARLALEYQINRDWLELERARLAQECARRPAVDDEEPSPATAAATPAVGATAPPWDCRWFARGGKTTARESTHGDDTARESTHGDDTAGEGPKLRVA